MTDAEIDQILASWNDLVEFITTADEQQCLALLNAEKRGPQRLTFLLRIHSRLNKVRADRERAELVHMTGAESSRAKQILEREPQ